MGKTVWEAEPLAFSFQIWPRKQLKQKEVSVSVSVSVTVSVTVTESESLLQILS